MLRAPPEAARLRCYEDMGEVWTYESACSRIHTQHLQLPGIRLTVPLLSSVSPSSLVLIFESLRLWSWQSRKPENTVAFIELCNLSLTSPICCASTVSTRHTGVIYARRPCLSLALNLSYFTSRTYWTHKGHPANHSLQHDTRIISWRLWCVRLGVLSRSVGP
jgi:hypothetical protein